MEALLKAAKGDHEDARTLITEVVQWANQHGYIRLFTDMGSEMEKMLAAFEAENKPEQDYVRKILAAFSPNAGHIEQKHIVDPPKFENQIEPLTNREFEVLTLLGKRLTNQEIAADLHITVGTVAQHLNNIYSKLAVKGRRQANARAKELGLLPPDK